MRVYFIGAGPGDPELLTIKAQRLIAVAQICIYAGSLICPEVLKLIPADAEKYDSAGMNLEQILAVMADAKGRGVDVMRLHTGEPALFGAIGEQMNALARMQVEYEVIPGISSFQAAAAALRCELTAPQVSQTVILTRTAGRTPVPESQSLSVLGQAKATLCLFLSVHKIADMVAELRPHYGAACPVAVVYRCTWPDQQIVRGTLDDIAAKVQAAGISKTAQVLVGEAIGGEYHLSELYAASFSHGYRQGDAG